MEIHVDTHFDEPSQSIVIERAAARRAFNTKGVWLMRNRTASDRFIAATRGTQRRAFYWGICALGMTIAASAHEPRIITFDAPGAGTAQYQGTGCFAYTDCSVLINNRGEITGYFLDTNNVYHGFLRSREGKFTVFEAPGADTKAEDFNGTLANGINDAGAITGVYYDSNNNGHGFLRSPEGKFTTFDVPGGILGAMNPIALNREAEIVGYYVAQNGVSQAFLRHSDGTFETWSGPRACDAASGSNACYGSGAFSINDFGTVAGGYEDDSGNLVNHGLVRSPEGKLTTFEAPGSGTGLYQGTGSPGSSVPLNQFGAIAGYYIDASNVVHGYLRAPWGEITTFDVPGEGSQGIGCYSDCSIGLNNWGAITGYYLDANNVFHGFVRSPWGNVTTFDAPGANTTPGAYSGTFPVSINDEGEITGYYLDTNNVNHGFVLLPSDDD